VISRDGPTPLAAARRLPKPWPHDKGITPEMRIVAIREKKTVSIASPIANAYIDFSKMTCSVVAVVTDVVREGKPVVGYGFNSNGRYGQGALMRERFLPRLLEAAPEQLIDRENDNLDPFAIWKVLMTNDRGHRRHRPRPCRRPGPPDSARQAGDRVVFRRFSAPRPTPPCRWRRPRQSALHGRRASYAAIQKPEGEISEVSYMFPRPGADKTPVAKVSLVTRVGDLGCGVGYYK
jgi:hypothetical protein